MGLKNGEAALAADWAIKGWVTYVQQVTRDLAPDHPVDERMAYALTGEELPLWLEDGIRIRLVASRTQAMQNSDVRCPTCTASMYRRTHDHKCPECRTTVPGALSSAATG